MHIVVYFYKESRLKPSPLVIEKGQRFVVLYLKLCCKLDASRSLLLVRQKTLPFVSVSDRIPITRCVGKGLRLKRRTSSAESLDEFGRSPDGYVPVRVGDVVCSR